MLSLNSLVSNQAHENIRQKAWGRSSNRKQSKRIWYLAAYHPCLRSTSLMTWMRVESRCIAIQKWIKQTYRHRSTGNWRVDLSNQLKIVTWCSPTSMTRKKLMCNRIIHEIDSVHVNHRRAEYYRNHCRITSPRPRNLDYCGNGSGLDINRRKPTSNK